MSQLPELAADEAFEIVLAATSRRNPKTRKNWTAEELSARAARHTSAGSFDHVRVESGKLIVQVSDPRGLGPYTIAKRQS